MGHEQRRYFECKNAEKSTEQKLEPSKSIAEYIGIDRKTLRRYMKRLIEMHLVTREPGKHGKYFPTTKRHRGTSISADILAESFRERFLAPLNEKRSTKRTKKTV
jgi:predicted transcriptional regulator